MYHSFFSLIRVVIMRISHHMIYFTMFFLYVLRLSRVFKGLDPMSASDSMVIICAKEFHFIS